MLVAQAKQAEEYFFGKPLSDDITEEITKSLRRDAENIVLRGMPGCGKTTIGGEIARITGRELLDTDEIIVKNAGISIPDIFEKYGEARFRELEREAVSEAGKLGGKIITTGGGAVKDIRNLAPLRQNGRIYHI